MAQHPPNPALQPPISKPAPVVSSNPHCTVEEREGGASVHFRIEPEIWKRYVTRMGKTKAADYLWENVLRRNVTDHVF